MAKPKPDPEPPTFPVLRWPTGRPVKLPVGVLRSRRTAQELVDEVREERG